MAEEVAEATDSLPKETGLVGLELATSGLTRRRSNRSTYTLQSCQLVNLHSTSSKSVTADGVLLCRRRHHPRRQSTPGTGHPRGTLKRSGGLEVKRDKEAADVS